MRTLFGEFLPVPRGEFLMGNDRSFLGYGGAPREEHVQARNVHRVKITRGLLFLSTPLTCGAVAGFVESCPDRFAGATFPWKRYRDPAGSYAQGDAIDHPPGEAAVDVALADYLRDPANVSMPAVGLDHADAIAFCAHASVVLGLKVRLPTEAEWEYACRAGTRTLYYFGDDTRAVPSHAWCCVNSGLDAHPVGAFPPNPWGLRDIVGNVWEWCSDNYSKGYYAESPTEDPRCEDITCGERVVRGGGALNKAETCRSSHRFGLKPSTRSRFLGIRPVVEIE
jgi:formylglycine-generating enzyme required for sulfatase activity